MVKRFVIGDETKLREEMSRMDSFGSINVKGLMSAPAVKVRRTVIEVPLEAITADSPFQTRRPFDPARYEDDQDLVASLAELGQREPVCLKEIEPGRYQKVYGHRRIAALRYLEQKTVLAIVVTGDLLELATTTAIENTGLPLSSIEQAELAQLFEEKLNLTRKQIASRLGCSERHIKHLRELLRADDAVRFALGEGRISARTARALAHAPRECQPELAKIAVAYRLTETEAQRLVEHLQATRSTPEEAAKALGLLTPPETAGQGVPSSDNGGPSTRKPLSAGRRRRRDLIMSVEMAVKILEAAVPTFPRPAVTTLAKRAAERGVSLRCLRIAGLLALTIAPEKALDAALAIQDEPIARAALDILQAENRLQTLMRHKPHIAEAPLLLKALNKLLARASLASDLH
jgi:ParB/RepB/Spo0J family partition protein